jgi:nucleoside-diphosphate-sugar epimerase
MNSSDLVLITGGSGFIGGRLVESLVAKGFRIRVATSDVKHCARIAELPVEIMKAGLGDHDALSRAAAGCNVVFHTAYRFGGNAAEQAVNLEGTRALAEAFSRSGGRRFVHVSSMCAYGDPLDGDLTEDMPLRQSADAYSDTKRKIDLLLIDMHRSRGLPVTILQPTIVYGPYGTFWTAEMIRQTRSMRIALPGGGAGLCNAVFVDDVVTALMLAAERDAAVGEMFLISGSAPVTWREFYGAFEKMTGRKALVDLDETQWAREQRRWQQSRSLTRRIPRAIARRIVPGSVKAFLRKRPRRAPDAESPLFFPEGPVRSLFSSKTHIGIEKARRLLGYDPAFNLNDGMALTAQWARLAGQFDR